MTFSTTTNEQFISTLINDSNYGGLSQVFIIEAIRYYSEAISSQPVPEENNEAFISPVAWHGVATEIHQKIKAKYENDSGS